MKTDVIKRNYFTIVLSILKDETSKSGNHYTAEQLCDRLNEKYGVRPDRKTILNVVKDLKEFGYDINLCRGKDAGYYLDEREFSISELSIISDSIEAMKIPVDMKTTIYDKLEKITGISTGEFDPTFYDDENYFDFYNDDEGSEDFKERLKIVLQAIKEKRKLSVHTLCSLPTLFITEPSKKVLDYFHNEYLFFLNSINPVKLFHNNENEIFVFFYVIVENETCYGAVDITQPESIILSEERFTPIKGSLKAMSEIDINNFISAKDYRKGNKELSACFSLLNGPLGFIYDAWLKEFCISLEERNLAGNDKVIVMKYYQKDLNNLIEFFIENSNLVKLIRNDLDKENTLYDSVYDLYSKLKSSYDTRG